MVWSDLRLENSFAPEKWHELYAMVGGADAALMGLLFIALSLHVGPITQHPEMRGRARQTLASFLTRLVLSLLVLIPQPPGLLGVELVALAIGDLVHRLGVQYSLVFNVGVSPGSYYRYVTFDIAVGLIGFTGFNLMTRSGPGMPLLIPVMLVIVALCLLNAWTLLVNIGDHIHDTGPSPRRIGVPLRRQSGRHRDG